MRFRAGRGRDLSYTNVCGEDGGCWQATYSTQGGLTPVAIVPIAVVAIPDPIPIAPGSAFIRMAMAPIPILALLAGIQPPVIAIGVA